MTHVIIMAGGKGTRMKSDLPKVLHPVAGTPIILRLLENISSVCPRPTLIVGHGAADVVEATGNRYDYVLQAEQLGTGHAVACAKADLEKRTDFNTVVVLNGDHPLVRAETIENIIAKHTETGATVTIGTFRSPHFEDDYSIFNNFGRIVKDATGHVERIVEFKDASTAERAIKEVNLNYYAFDAAWLWKNIEALKSENAAHEYYLTDMVKIANDQGRRVTSYPIKDFIECLGVNTPEQLRMVEDAIGASGAKHEQSDEGLTETTTTITPVFS